MICLLSLSVEGELFLNFLFTSLSLFSFWGRSLPEWQARTVARNMNWQTHFFGTFGSQQWNVWRFFFLLSLFNLLFDRDQVAQSALIQMDSLPGKAFIVESSCDDGRPISLNFNTTASRVNISWLWDVFIFRCQTSASVYSHLVFMHDACYHYTTMTQFLHLMFRLTCESH